MTANRPGLVARIFLPFAFAYSLSYLFRTVNAVIAPDLMEAFALTPDQLGLLSGAYFLTFAVAQLPLGVALDRFGSRRTEAILLLVAAIGGVVFAAAQSFADLFLGRALIGLGVSACLMAAFRAFVYWFPKDRLPMINGCQMAAGGAGAIAATTPVELALQVVDWRGVFLGLSALTLASSALLIVFAPEDSKGETRASAGALVAGLGRVFASSLFWRVVPVTIASQASFLAIQSLWTGPWLTNVGGLSRVEVARILMLIAISMIAGFLVMGWLAVRLNRLGIPPIQVALVGMILFMTNQIIIIADVTDHHALVWALFGFFGTTGIMPYAALSQRFPVSFAGRLNTGINVLVFSSAFLLQWGIGATISAWHLAVPSADVGQGFQVAFAAVVALQVAGALWYFLYRGERVPTE